MQRGGHDGNGRGEQHPSCQAELANASEPRCRLQMNPENRGFSGGMNSGAANVGGDWLLLVNNDTLFPEGTLDRWRQILEGVPDDVGLVGPASNASGTGQQIGLVGRPTEEILDFGARLAREPVDLLFTVQRVDFFCVAIRRTAWEALGGLDESFGLGYYEDFDLSLRAREEGWGQVASDDVLVAHIGSASFSTDSKRQKTLMKANKRRLLAKHGDVSFEHQRDGNLAILEQYREAFHNRDLTPAAALLIGFRLREFGRNMPKGWLKRWLWRRRSSPVIAGLAGAQDHLH